jgi:hypothetical protein
MIQSLDALTDNLRELNVRLEVQGVIEFCVSIRFIEIRRERLGPRDSEAGLHAAHKNVDVMLT